MNIFTLEIGKKIWIAFGRKKIYPLWRALCYKSSLNGFAKGNL
jgi:hypothetical protein